MEYIERNLLLSDIDNLYLRGKVTLKECITNQPTADVVPVVQGEWNKLNDAIVCSSCGFGMFPICAWSKNGKHKRDEFIPQFCPNCGADMRQPRE